MTGTLTRDNEHDSDRDYTLAPEESCWITVKGKFSVFVRETPDGVAVEISARGSEGDSTIDTASATEDDVEELPGGDDEDPDELEELPEPEEIDEDQEAEDLRSAIQVVLSLARENILEEFEVAGDEDSENCRKIQTDAFQLVYSYLENEELV